MGWLLPLFIASFFTTFSLHSLEIKNCTLEREKSLEGIHQRAQEKIFDLNLEIFELPPEILESREWQRVREKIECMQNRITEVSYRCTSSQTATGALAYIPSGWQGAKTIRISNFLFFSRWRLHKEKIGALIHELSHTCGTVDAAYFGGATYTEPHQEKYPDGRVYTILNFPQSFKGTPWWNIADTYKYWSEEGFCIPEVNCSSKK